MASSNPIQAVKDLATNAKEAITPKSENAPEPVTQEALDEGRVQPNPDTEGMTLEEENKKADEQKKLDEERKQTLKSIMNSSEGFIKRDEKNASLISTFEQDGDVYVQNVQSGPGGTQVEERVFLTGQGYVKAGQAK